MWTISHHYVQVSLYADYFVNVRLLTTEVMSMRLRFNQQDRPRALCKAYTVLDFQYELHLLNDKAFHSVC